MGTMFQDAEHSIKIMTSEEGLNDIYENHSDLLREAKDKGVSLKVLAPVSDKNQEAFESLSEVAEVRHVGGIEEKLEELDEAPDGRLAIIDDEALTMAMTHDEVHATQDTAFWSKSDHMADNMLSPMFNMLWQHSEKPEGPSGPNGPE